MIRLLSFFAALMVCFPVWAGRAAARKAEPFPRLLTSRQLLALTPPRRLAYFIKVRKMLRELSAMNHRGHGTLIGFEADQESEFYSQLLQYLDSMGRLVLPEANAGNCSSQYPFDLGPLCGVPCAGRGTREDETGQAVNNYYFCFPRDKFYEWYPNSEVSPLKMSPAVKMRLQIGDKNQLPTHAPERSLPTPARIEAVPVEQEEPAIPAVADSPAVEANSPPVEELKVSDSPAVTNEAPINAAVIQATETPTSCRSNSKPPKGDLVYSDCSQSWVNDEILKGQDAALAKEVVAKKEKDKEEATAEKIAEAVPPSGTACAAPQFSCDEKERSNYRSKQRSGALDKFRKGSPKNCIYGGNMSGYRNGEVKAGNCAAVSDFCSQKEKCTGTAEDVEDGFKSKYSCERGKTLCSPFIFGLANRTTGICVPAKGSDVTDKCDQAAEKISGKAAYVGDLLNSKLPGVANAWDEYADAFNKICEDGSDSQAAHCEECAVIGKRLVAANFMATGKCNKALKSTESKPAETKDPAPATER